MKIFFKFGLLLPLPFVILVWVNRHFDEGYFSVPTQMAQMMNAKQRIGLPRQYLDYDERQFQKAVIAGKTVPDDVVVFGSSRVRYIRSSLFSGQSFHNYAVNAASLEDYILLYGMLKERNLPVKHLILGLDYWALMKDSGYTNWQTLASDYRRAAEAMGIDVSAIAADTQKAWSFRRTLEMFSISYFQHNLGLIWAQGLNRPDDRNFATQETEIDKVWVINEDGSWGDQKIQASVDEVRNLVRTVDAGVPTMKEIDPAREGIFRKFMDTLRADGVKVTLLLLPVHPYSYEQWTTSHRVGIDIAEQYYQKVADQYGNRVVGSFSPDRVGAVETDFRDWLHPRRPIIERILQRGLSLSQL